ncbi:hypothetical protein [Clostridium sp.]|uniref:hypothetical protein n=1 Tax=Clostridium sp. TaxID=1506 RepID=UPI0026300A5B|nr:hypothetical protein [uncultured Clostridium sp.]
MFPYLVYDTSYSSLFGSFESLFVNDTYQFNDYSKYVSTCFYEKKKAQVRKEQFPKECINAFNMEVRFAE